jgi:hypothetical protein
MKIKIVCAWCQRVLGSRECECQYPAIDPVVSHGICPECKEKVLASMEKTFATEIKSN